MISLYPHLGEVFSYIICIKQRAGVYSRGLSEIHLCSDTEGHAGLIHVRHGGPIDNMKFILGTKAKMTTVFTEDGRSFAATVIMVGPAVVTQVKTVEKEGYNAIQIATGETKKSRANKAQVGHSKGFAGEGKSFKIFREFREHDNSVVSGIEAGSAVDVSTFAVGDKVTVSAISKGKGFQGVVKRHGFHGGPRSHGQKHSERSPGSIGGSGGRAGGRVARGMRMAGRMGSDRVTVRNLSILQIHPKTGEMVISGAIPGKTGTLVEVKGNSR